MPSSMRMDVTACRQWSSCSIDLQYCMLIFNAGQACPMIIFPEFPIAMLLQPSQHQCHVWTLFLSGLLPGLDID